MEAFSIRRHVSWLTSLATVMHVGCYKKCLHLLAIKSRRGIEHRGRKKREGSVREERKPREGERKE
jgi:hypothetical protein